MEHTAQGVVRVKKKRLSDLEEDITNFRARKLLEDEHKRKKKLLLKAKRMHNK